MFNNSLCRSEAEEEALISTDCPFSWCKYSQHKQHQATTMTSSHMELGSDAHATYHHIALTLHRGHGQNLTGMDNSKHGQVLENDEFRGFIFIVISCVSNLIIDY